jgi:hypothetical protein
MAFLLTDPHAWMGYAAMIMLRTNADITSALAADTRLRASSFAVQMKQEVNKTPLIDGLVDISAYSLGMKKVEGDIGFPLIHEGANLTYPSTKSSGCGNSLTSPIKSIWQLAAQRNQYGRLTNYFDMDVVYPDNTQIRYGGCVVNNVSIKVVQNGPVDVTMGVVGGANAEEQRTDAVVPSAFTSIVPNNMNNSDPAYVSGSGFNPAFLAPARIVTWNDFVLAVYNGTTAQLANGDGVREFSVDLKNNVEQYATLNGRLEPQDVTAKKREISGMIKLLGRNNFLNYMGLSNESRFTSEDSLAFGYRVGTGNIYWATALHGLVYKIEEMTINPGEVFETTVSYDALGDCTFNFESTEIGTNPSALTLPNPTTPNSYGGVTRTGPGASGFDMGSPFDGWTG